LCPGSVILSGFLSYKTKKVRTFGVDFAPKDEDCSYHSQNVSQVLAYIGVFDGGPLAAECCSEGLLQHILAETRKTAYVLMRKSQ
jgi:hypothetical protein